MGLLRLTHLSPPTTSPADQNGKDEHGGQTMTKCQAIKLMNDNPNATFGASVAAQLLAAMHGGRGGDWRAWVSRYHGDTMTGSRIQRTKKRV